MQLSVKQNQYINESNHRWNIKGGATGSGKTFLDFVYLIPNRLLERKGLNGLNVILGVTQQTIERNVLEPMRKHWGTDLVGEIEKGTSKCILFGEIVYCLGAEKINNVSKIQGATIKFCYGDEITKWNREVFEMLKSRLRENCSVFDGTCNPDNPNHFVKKFIDSDVDIYYQSYEIDDNPFLPKDFVENLKKEYANTVYYDRYILGKWALAEGLIFRNFADNAEKYIETDLSKYVLTNSLTNKKSYSFFFLTVGVDFGGTKSNTVFTCTSFINKFRELLALKDRKIDCSTGRVTPDDLEREFIAFLRDIYDEFGMYPKYAFCDSAEQTLINGLRKAVKLAGIPTKVQDCEKKTINGRIDFLVKMLNIGRLKIYKDCTHIINSLKGQVWDDKHKEDVRLDDNTTADIDTADSFEYSFSSYMDRFTFG